jgi:isoquinoline 1-oxidoreductase beta subunit
VRDVRETPSGIVVVADSWWQARQARDVLTIDWDPGPNASLDNAAIMRGLSNALDTRAADAKIARNDGNANAVLASAANKIEAVYELPMLAHATLEPQNCTVEPRGDTIIVHAPTQVQQAAQAAAAAAAGVAPEKVIIKTTLLGGGFGRRLETDFIPAAVVTALALNRPVKLVWTREDDTTHDYYRPPYRHRASAALAADGSLDAYKLEICGPSVTSRWAPAAVAEQIDPFVLEAATNFPYTAPNVLVTYLQHEIGIDVGYLRSVSHATNCFAAESFVDELAQQAGKDPYEFRKALLAKQSDPRWLGVLERAAARAGWGRAAQGRYQGIALMEGYGSYLALVTEISLEAGKVRVHKVSGAVDVGRMVNPAIVESQIHSGIIFGLTAALWGDITLEKGAVQQQSFDTYRLMRINEAPVIDVEIVASDAAPGGIGEPSVALMAPALANALYAATKQRVRSLPLSRHGFA